MDNYIKDYKEDAFVTCKKCGRILRYDSRYSYYPDAVGEYIDYCTNCAPEPPSF